MYVCGIAASTDTLASQANHPYASNASPEFSGQANRGRRRAGKCMKTLTNTAVMCTPTLQHPLLIRGNSSRGACEVPTHCPAKRQLPGQPNDWSLDHPATNNCYRVRHTRYLQQAGQPTHSRNGPPPATNSNAKANVLAQHKWPSGPMRCIPLQAAPFAQFVQPLHIIVHNCQRPVQHPYTRRPKQQPQRFAQNSHTYCICQKHALCNMPIGLQGLKAPIHANQLGLQGPLSLGTPVSKIVVVACSSSLCL